MTDSKMWVPVNVAAKILKVGNSTIKRQAATRELLCRRIGRSLQISRISICQNCLKECFPDITEYPLNCDNCEYFKLVDSKINKNPPQIAPISSN